jgi:hypothetical protein
MTHSRAVLTKIRSHLTQNLIAYLALFVALGGTSYGLASGSVDSREIKNNTVRTGDLRNNEVRSRDIRNRTIVGRDLLSNTLGGDQIDETELGEIPLATRSETADNALALGGQPATSFSRTLTNALDVNDENSPTTLLTVTGYGTLSVPDDGCEADDPNEALDFVWKNTTTSSQDVFVDVEFNGNTLVGHEVVSANQESLSSTATTALHAELLIRQLNSNSQAATISLFARNGGPDVGDDCRISIQALLSG